MSDPGGPRLRIAAVVFLGLLAAVLGLVLLQGGGGRPVAAGRDTTTTTSTTTAVTTTTVTPTSLLRPTVGVVAPLSGVVVPLDQAARLDRPALAVKVDNAPAATPQRGLGAADVVIEVRVEGISRFIAVFHANDVATVGPVRSARTSDPDLLAAFGRPLFGWSGGNPAVVQTVRSTPWIQDLQYGVLPGAYRRERGRSAPHNLVLRPAALWAAARAPVVRPHPVFRYRDPAEPAAGRPVAGMVVPVGSPPTYLWDAGRGGWLRWAGGRRHTDDSGDQLAPANVVVLATPYVASPADVRSPEARTVGAGRAWVYTGGHVVTGTWSRPDRTAPWTLLDDSGRIVGLAPGQTWIELPEQGAPPSELSAASARRLVFGR